MTSITVEHVSKTFVLKDRTIEALKDVSLKISEGGSVSIIGPSGCGKTTLLRMIAGLEVPDSGEVLYDDEPMRDTPPEERGIGMVFQNYALVPQWSAQSNIGFFLRLRRREREVPERVKHISAITGVGIDELMGKFPRQLSGGEKQRVAIARAFARDLKMLLFDEPFAHLDAKLRTQARVETRKLLNRYPVTTVFVTHDQQEAALLTDRIILMRDGNIEQVGSYESLYDAPANIFVAEFIGVPTTNLFEGTVRDGRWYGDTFGGFTLPVPIAEGTAVTLGIRPEYIHVDSEAGVSAKIQRVTPFFAERYTLLEVVSGEKSWEIKTEAQSPLQVGDTIRCRFVQDTMHFFDTASGERIT
ncbi:MAG: ABC transporter ATP-binding protein [Chloroflexota bacterium]